MELLLDRLLLAWPPVAVMELLLERQRPPLLDMELLLDLGRDPTGCIASVPPPSTP